MGISAFTETYPNAQAIAAQVKGFDASLPVVFGGPHPSILPVEVMEEWMVDFVVVGEGEAAMADLVEALSTGGDFSAIPGLVWRDGGAIITNVRREPLDPDSIGLPARDLLSLEFYADPFNVLTARGGCPYRCPFCSASQIWSGKHRPRKPSEVVDEIDGLIRTYGAGYIFFVDDIFTLRRDWVLELLSEMERLPAIINGAAARASTASTRNSCALWLLTAA